MMSVFMFRHPVNFFTDAVIKRFKKMRRGYVYIVIYHELYLLGLDIGNEKEGRIFFETVEDDFYSELALRIDEKREDVEFVLKYLVDRERVVLRPSEVKSGVLLQMDGSVVID